MDKRAAQVVTGSLGALLLLGAVGCSSTRAPVATTLPGTTQPTTSSAAVVSARAQLPLEQIQPEPQFPAPKAVAAGVPPLEAIELFALARENLIDGKAGEAAGLLEKALLLDQESFELYYALGEAYLGDALQSQRSLEAFEKAAEFRPDDLSTRVQLGRQYLSRDDLDRALQQLRLAIKTPGYARGDNAAPAADLFLARTLQRMDYSRAAYDRYQKLLAWLDGSPSALRANAEMNFLLTRPEVIYEQLADLAQKLGREKDAIEVYRKATARDPHQLGIRVRYLELLAASGNRSETTKASTELLVDFNADATALNAVRSAYDKLKRRPQLADDLQRASRQNPDSRPLRLSLIQILQEDGRIDEAQVNLQHAWQADPSDPEVLRRLVAIHLDRGEMDEAARVLIESAAREPDVLRATTSLWSALLRPSTRYGLRIGELQKLQVSSDAQAVKLYWVARLANLWNRQSLSRTALEEAVTVAPPFAPAYRMQLGETMVRDDLDDAQKQQAVQQLIDRARAQGNNALAIELRGLQSLLLGKVRESLDDLRHSMALHPSPDIRLEYAEALLRDKQNVQAEQILWQLLKDWPSYPEAYQRLFVHYAGQNSLREAIRVLQTWLQADPNSIEARTLHAVVLMRGRRTAEADRVITALLDEASDQPEVLDTAQALYASTGRIQIFIDKLEAERATSPDNLQVVERLVAIYAQQNRRADASRVLDAMRQSVAGDPDLLYYLGHLYMQIDQPEMTEKVYEQVLSIDPLHPAASNDLGYNFADKGLHLDRAEALIRVAVDAEPDNHSFLDSLGWVLYKRGKFAEAADYLQRAIGEAARPDPVVLDHLGDALYRMDRKEEAVQYWNRALERIPEVQGVREELMNLRLVLRNKLRQVEANQPVQLAPAGDEPAHPPTTAPASQPTQVNPDSEL